MRFRLLCILFLSGFNTSSAQGPCALPAVLFPADTVVICSGASFTIHAPVISGAQYAWSGGGMTDSLAVNVSGQHILQISLGTCTVTDTITVLFNSFLLAPQAGDVMLCKGKGTQALQVPGQNLLWYTGPVGGTGTPLAPVPSVADTGRVTWWVSQTIRGCESPRTAIQVKVIDKPFFELGDPFIIPCNTSGIVLQVVPGEATDYTWSNGSHETEIIAATRGKYSLYAENMCGNYRDTVLAMECHDKCVQTPTAFSPNSDGRNDRFTGVLACPVPSYFLALYNRNGEKVFETKTPGAGWDGNFNGKAQPEDVYIFLTRYFDFILKKEVFEKGSFLLIR